MLLDSQSEHASGGYRERIRADRAVADRHHGVVTPVNGLRDRLCNNLPVRPVTGSGHQHPIGHGSTALGRVLRVKVQEDDPQ